MGIPADLMGNERLMDFETTERSSGIGTAAGKFWFQTPYYTARWNYLHRPSVWNRMSQTGKLEWHGISGFKNIFAGETGIGYKGDNRKINPVSKWMLRQGGRGISGIGGLIKGFSTTPESIPIPQNTYYSIQTPKPTITTADAIRIRNRTTYNIGNKFIKAGKAFETGGVGGLVTSVSGRSDIGTKIQQIFGGAVVNRAGQTGNLIRAGFTEDQAASILQMANKSGIKGLTRGGRYASMLNPYKPYGFSEDMVPLYESMHAARGKAISSAFRFAGATKLMAGGAVVLNIALFGGMLANLTYGAARTLGETTYRMRNNMYPGADFGSGISPFTSGGAYTERQRAIQAIQGSRLNARGAIGNEAGLMHDMAF